MAYKQEAKSMTEPKKQPLYYVVFFDIDYPSVAEALAEAPEAIAAHKKRSQEWHEQGKLVMAGAFRDSSEGRLNTISPAATSSTWLTGRPAASRLMALTPCMSSVRARASFTRTPRWKTLTMGRESSASSTTTEC